MPDLPCPKCGAAVTITPGIFLTTCRYCESRLFIDRSGLLFTYIIPFSIDRTGAEEIFRRWASGPLVPKELLSRSGVPEMRKTFFPVYLFRRVTENGEKTVIRAARATAAPGMSLLTLPPGDLKVFDQTVSPGDAEVLSIDIPITTYLDGLPGTPKEQALVHFPIYSVQYQYNGEPFSLTIDGSTGAVYPGAYPSRSSRPYGIVAAAGFFLGLAGVLFGTLFAPMFYALVPAGIATAFLGGYQIAGGG